MIQDGLCLWNTWTILMRQWIRGAKRLIDNWPWLIGCLDSMHSNLFSLYLYILFIFTVYASNKFVLFVAGGKFPSWRWRGEALNFQIWNIFDATDVVKLNFRHFIFFWNLISKHKLIIITLMAAISSLTCKWSERVISALYWPFCLACVPF